MRLDYLIERSKLLAVKLFVRGANALQAYELIAIFLERYMSEITTDGSLKPLAQRAQNGAPTILFINRPHYPDAVDVLARCEDLRCLELSNGLLRYLLASFIHEPTFKEKKKQEGTYGWRYKFRMAEPGSSMYEKRKRYRTFLHKLLPVLFARHGIDLIFNSDARYRREADITQVASELGVPHICMPRDSMFIIPANFNKSVGRHRHLGTFQGDQLLVQNEATRQVLLQSGHARDDQITVLGSIRMDDFLKRMKQGANSQSERKLVLMFTWPPRRYLLNGDAFDLFKPSMDTVRALARLAMKRPHLDFAVKLKKIHVENGQLERLREVVNKITKSSELPSNLTFYTKAANASELIQKASVICAMQSTTVLEAAVSGKPVILPHFKSLRSLLGAEEVLMYGDSRHLFDVPDTEDDLVRLIERRLEDKIIPDDIQRERRELFSSHVAPLSGDTVGRCIQLLKNYMLAGRRRRAEAGNDKYLVAQHVGQNRKASY